MDRCTCLLPGMECILRSLHHFLSGAFPSTANGRSGGDGNCTQLESLAGPLAEVDSAAARNMALAESSSKSLRGVRTLRSHCSI